MADPDPITPSSGKSSTPHHMQHPSEERLQYSCYVFILFLMIVAVAVIIDAYLKERHQKNQHLQQESMARVSRITQRDRITQLMNSTTSTSSPMLADKKERQVQTQVGSSQQAQQQKKVQIIVPPSSNEMRPQEPTTSRQIYDKTGKDVG